MVRTTLTLDEDVASALARRRAERGTGLRDEVNDLLRAGLAAADRRPEDDDEGYELPTFDPGHALITDHRELRELVDEEDLQRGLRRPGP